MILFRRDRLQVTTSSISSVKAAVKTGALASRAEMGFSLGAGGEKPARGYEEGSRMAGMVKGPAIFLAQFAGDAAPFNSFDAICKWAASLGYKGVQIPSWDGRLIDLAKAASNSASLIDFFNVSRSAREKLAIIL